MIREVLKGWRDVPGFEGLYMVNAKGEILSLKILKPQTAKDHKSPRVQLRDKAGNLSQVSISKVVAEVFGL